MLVEELQTGVHVSTEEMDWVASVVSNIRGQGYKGPIEVVGSRSQAHRISRKALPYLEEDETHWVQKLDNIVAQHDIPAGRVRSEVPRLLSPDTPPKIKSIFNCTHPDSDLDLLLTEEKSGPLTIDYSDKKSGLVIEVWGNDDTSHLLIDPLNF